MSTRVVAGLATIVVTLACAVGPAHAAVVEAKGGMMSVTSGIAFGADGNFWVVETLSGSVARVSPSGAILGRLSVGAEPVAAAAGPGGRVWVTVAGTSASTRKLVWIDALAASPATHDVPTTTASDCAPSAIVAGGDGRMYFSLPHQAPCTAVSRLASIADSGTGAIAFAAGRGTVIDLAVSGGKLFAPDVEGSVVRRLALGTALSVESVVTVTAGSAPAGVAPDGAGNIWVTEYAAGRVARFPAVQLNGSAQEFVPAGGTLKNPFGIVAGPDGRMYVAGTGSANIVRVDGNGSFAFFAVAQGIPFRVVDGPDGDLWLTDLGNPRVLRFVNAAPRVTTGSANATAVTATVTAKVDTRGNPTQVVFDYGPTTAYGSTSAPVNVPAGSGPVDVTAALPGLRRLSSYHLRARATSVEGSAAGADAVFTTPDLSLLEAHLAFAGTTRGRLTTISKFRITDLAGGETAVLRCAGKGKGCPFKHRVYTAHKKGTLDLSKLFGAKHRLRPRARISVQITAPGAIGRSIVLSTRSGRTPKLRHRCLVPGEPKSSRCPA